MYRLIHFAAYGNTIVGSRQTLPAAIALIASDYGHQTHERLYLIERQDPDDLTQPWRPIESHYIYPQPANGTIVTVDTHDFTARDRCTSWTFYRHPVFQPLTPAHD